MRLYCHMLSSGQHVPLPPDLQCRELVSTHMLKTTPYGPAGIDEIPKGPSRMIQTNESRVDTMDETSTNDCPVSYSLGEMRCETGTQSISEAQTTCVILSSASSTWQSLIGLCMTYLSMWIPTW